MGHGGQHHIKPTGGNLLPDAARGGEKIDSPKPPKTEDQTPKHPKTNAAPMFDQKWANTQAAERRNNLSAMIPHSDNNAQTERRNNASAMISNGENHAPAERGKSNAPQQFEQTKDTVNVPRQFEQAKNTVNKSWDDLVNLAREHKDLKSFSSEPKKFWDEVKKMSELRVVEKYVNGKLEPRVASRYGDLLEMLNRYTDNGSKGKSADGGIGSRLQSFLTSLPKSERNVFLARYQINQTFGASELFAGRRGVALNKNGQFPLQNFLSANGKNQELSASSVLSLLGGDVSEKEVAKLLEQSDIFLGSQLLINPKSAALLGLGLALCQNINALLALDEIVQEAFIPKQSQETNAPKILNEPIAAPRFNAKNVVENSETFNVAATKRAGEMLAAGALVNGALATIERYNKVKRQSLDLWADAKADDAGFRFSAGATGAMMGATVGCVVPLAEKGIGEILGFASSVVVGLTDSGLRSLGANALVSVITSGVQTFLNASAVNQNSLNSKDAAANTFLNAAEATAEFVEIDSREKLFSRRADALLPA